MKPHLAVLFIGVAAVSSLISQSLLDLFSILSILMVLWVGFKTGTWRDLFTKIGIEWALGGFLLTCILGVVWNTSSPYFNHLRPIVKLNWMIHIYLLIGAFKMGLPKVEQGLKVLLGLALLPSVYAIVTKILNKDLLVPERPLEGRVIGLVNSATYHAHASAIIFVFCAGLLYCYFNPRKKNSWLYLMALTLLGLSLYFTYTRGAVLAVVLALLGGLALQNWRRALILAGFLALGGAGIIKMDPLLSERVSQTIVAEKMDTGRIGLFKSHLQMFLDHPLLGMGYDVYKNSPLALEYTQRFGVPEYLQDSHAHNQYLQILGSTGALGFFFFMAIVIFFFWQNLKLLRGTAQDSPLYPWALSAFWSQSCILLLFLTDQSFEYAKIRFVILSLWALVLGVATIQRTQANKK